MSQSRYKLGEMPERLRREVIEILAAQERARVVAACAQIRQAAKTGRERTFVEDGEGGGEVTMMIHPTSFHYWGQRLGYRCWDDKNFCREYLRDNPEARVRSRGKNLKMGWESQGNCGLEKVKAGNRKFTKVYGRGNNNN